MTDLAGAPGRVDAHHHVWDLHIRDQPWTQPLPRLRRTFTYDELADELAVHNIAATVVVQTINGEDETPELLALAAERETVAGVVGWADLTAPDVDERLDRLADTSGGEFLVGVRHQVQAEPDAEWLCRTDVIRGLRAVARRDLRYDLVVLPHQLPATLLAVRAVPELRFVLDHAGKPQVGADNREPWADQIFKLGRHDNVAIKLSGLVSEAGPSWSLDQLAPYVETVLDAFEPRRVMFGSDWPVCLLAATYRQVVDATTVFISRLSSHEQEEIWGGAARRWYGLSR